MDEASFFDNIAPTWDSNEVLSKPEKVNYILDFINIKQGQSILDLGTGTGVLLPFITERIGKEGKITAVDYSKGMLEIAKNKFSRLTPTPEFLNLDFEEETINGEYDKIILYCVYPHLHTPIETLKWLLKVNLRDEGELFIAFPCDANFINSIHKEKHSQSERLPSATKLAISLNQNGIKATVIKEDKEAYIIRIIK